MSKYVVVNLFQDPLKKHHEDIVNNLCLEFNVKPQKISAHVTLLPPFESEDITQLISYTEKFARGHKRMQTLVGGINFFRDNVIYYEVKLKPEDRNTLEQYIQKAETLTNSSQMIETPRTFHCTLFSRKISRKFEALINALKHETHVFETFIDNITLLKWDEKASDWKVERQFHFHP